MKIENVEVVAALTKERQQALDLITAAYKGELPAITIRHGDVSYAVMPIVSAEQLRQCIIESSAAVVRKIDKDLNQLGVSTPRRLEPKETVEGLRQDINMYVRVWIRELGGKLFNKAHLIDALAMTTKDMRERMLAAESELSSLKKKEAA